MMNIASVVRLPARKPNCSSNVAYVRVRVRTHASMPTVHADASMPTRPGAHEAAHALLCRLIGPIVQPGMYFQKCGNGQILT